MIHLRGHERRLKKYPFKTYRDLRGAKEIMEVLDEIGGDLVVVEVSIYQIAGDRY